MPQESCKNMMKTLQILKIQKKGIFVRFLFPPYFWINKALVKRKNTRKYIDNERGRGEREKRREITFLCTKICRSNKIWKQSDTKSNFTTKKPSHIFKISKVCQKKFFDTVVVPVPRPIYGLFWGPIFTMSVSLLKFPHYLLYLGITSHEKAYCD